MLIWADNSKISLSYFLLIFVYFLVKLCTKMYMLCCFRIFVFCERVDTTVVQRTVDVGTFDSIVLWCTDRMKIHTSPQWFEFVCNGNYFMFCSTCIPSGRIRICLGYIARCWCIILQNIICLVIMHLISNVDHFRCSNIHVSETELVLWYLLHVYSEQLCVGLFQSYHKLSKLWRCNSGLYIL